MANHYWTQNSNNYPSLTDSSFYLNSLVSKFFQQLLKKFKTEFPFKYQGKQRKPRKKNKNENLKTKLYPSNKLIAKLTVISDRPGKLVGKENFRLLEKLKVFRVK